MKKTFVNRLPYILITVLVLGAGAFFYYSQSIGQAPETITAAETQNIYLEFTNEVYDIIQKNYYEKISDEQLTNLYQKASDQVLGTHVPLPGQDKQGLGQMIMNAMESLQLNAEKRQQYVLYLNAVLLHNLPPAGRSDLLTRETQKDLYNLINNVNQGQDLYANLGVNNTASPSELKQAYEKQAQELAQQDTEEAKQKLDQLNDSYATLADPESRQRYDEAKIQSTISSKLIAKDVFYIKFTQVFSPLTLTELSKAVDSLSQTDFSPNTLILDLRGNIGGYIDTVPQLLGLFVGDGLHAYDFLRQDEYMPFYTQGAKFAALENFTNKIILIDSNNTSATELLAGTLKKFGVGTLVGTKTFGWGTIENLAGFPVSHQPDPLNRVYSVKLATHLTTIDKQPIEGMGIAPDINTEDNDWEKQLQTATDSQSALDAVKQILSGKVTF